MMGLTEWQLSQPAWAPILAASLSASFSLNLLDSQLSHLQRVEGIKTAILKGLF